MTLFAHTTAAGSNRCAAFPPPFKVIPLLHEDSLTKVAQVQRAVLIISFKNVKKKKTSLKYSTRKVTLSEEIRI